VQLSLHLIRYIRVYTTSKIPSVSISQTDNLLEHCKSEKFSKFGEPEAYFTHHHGLIQHCIAVENIQKQKRIEATGLATSKLRQN
jgi:hypothetical protein